MVKSSLIIFNIETLYLLNTIKEPLVQFQDCSHTQINNKPGTLNSHVFIKKILVIWNHLTLLYVICTCFWLLEHHTNLLIYSVFLSLHFQQNIPYST